MISDSIHVYPVYKGLASNTTTFPVNPANPANPADGDAGYAICCP